MMGLELFDNVDVESYGKEASKTAVTMLHADACPAERMPVAIESGFGGVFIHEACGHALEATSVAMKESVFSEKKEKKIASSILTLVDDGTLQNLIGSSNIDDEGNFTRRNVLIENGILKGYMVDRLNGRRMNATSTGNSRRQSYKFAPASRMTNTFIMPGSDEDSDIISSIPYGLYAKEIAGGSVNNITGEFNMSVKEGYLIKDGKIHKPVRGGTLIGKSNEILLEIDRVGKILKYGAGPCGSLSGGQIPVGMGSPLIRVSEMTVGGRWDKMELWS